MSEALLSLLLLIPLFLLANPFDLFMFSRLQMMALVLLVVLFGLFSVYIFKEKASDEREMLHRYVAGRFAYLVGAGALVLAIFVQTLEHTLDIWLVVVLVVMIFAKIVGLLYAKAKH